jgi:hypothetical protein
MKQAFLFVLAVFALTPGMFGQDAVPTIKAEARSAFVWGEDFPSGAVSSMIRDPLTGLTIRKLSYDGIEVNSRIGFEGIGLGQAGVLFTYTTTIINSTDSAVLVVYGGIRVDGYAASLLSILPARKKLSKKELKSEPDLVELGKIHCLTSDFFPSENLFSGNASSQTLTVVPRTSLTVSSIVRDPRRYHSVQCSVEGCYPTGTIRYYISVDHRDYVFAWPGRSAVYCGR